MVALAVALAAGALTWARPAQAFVCSRAVDAQSQPTLVSLAWPGRTVPLSFAANGTTQISADDANTALRASITVWEQVQVRPTENCTPAPTDIKMPVDDALTDQFFAGYNYLAPTTNKNVLMFRDDRWAHGGIHADSIALTTATYNAQTGEIYDADIEFNTSMFVYSVGDSNIATDLRNTATHELGHVLGFAHSADETATMFYKSATHDTLKRLLSCDDVTMINFRYPAGGATGYCDAATVDATCGSCAPVAPLSKIPTIQVVGTDAGGSGCAAAPAGGLPWAGLATAAVIWRRSRRRAEAVP